MRWIDCRLPCLQWCCITKVCRYMLKTELAPLSEELANMWCTMGPGILILDGKNTGSSDRKEFYLFDVLLQVTCDYHSECYLWFILARSCWVMGQLLIAPTLIAYFWLGLEADSLFCLCVLIIYILIDTYIYIESFGYIFSPVTQTS